LVVGEDEDTKASPKKKDAQLPQQVGYEEGWMMMMMTY
jgi:hypothetical protein